MTESHPLPNDRPTDGPGAFRPASTDARQLLEERLMAYFDGELGASHGELVVSHDSSRATYTAQGATNAEGRSTSTCNDGNDPIESDYVEHLTWLETPSEGLEVSEDGTTIEGTHEVPAGTGDNYRYAWTLKLVAE